MKWSERLRTDFALAKLVPPVKTTGMAVQVALSPFWPVPDLVNPKIILDADHLFTKPVENLVFAVRGLSSKSYQAAHQNLRRIPLFHTVIQNLRDWDVEGINRELTLLQREPRGRTFADLAPFTIALLRPLFRFARLNPHVHLLPAVAKMFELGRVSVASKDEKDLLQRYYTIAREELPQVFTQLRQRVYPILLKLLSDKYLELDPFYLDREAEILSFLGLKDEDLLKDQPLVEAPTPMPSQGAPTTAPAVTVPRLAQQGLELLDQLFPRAGWKALGANPDLYSYFQGIFDYPKGSEHIPVDDPIQVIQPLSEVLQQLFYGFQYLQWGTAVNQAGETIRLQEELDKGIARWHFFHEEFFGKNYLPLLQEYCREVERSGPVAPEAKRREHQLMWFKRNYLMPHLSLPLMDDIRAKSLGYPNLAVQVREMLDLLTPVALEVEQKGSRATTLLNPDTKVRFPVQNMVSVRFQNALRRQDSADQGNNKTLVLATLSLLTTLDYLLSRPGSPLYLRRPPYLYRTSGQTGDEKPVYNAPKKNSVALLKKLNDQPPPPVSEVPWAIRGGEVLGPLAAAEELKVRIQGHQSDKKPFALVNFRVWPAEASGEVPGFLAPFLDQGTALHPQDDGTWAYVMKDTDEEEAEDFARKILTAAARRNPPLAAGALVVPYGAGWTLDKMTHLAPRGWVQARDIPAQVLGVWTNATQGFEFRTDVPTVEVPPSAPQSTPEPTPEREPN